MRPECAGLQFLRDSHLLDEGQHILDFTDADLTGDELRKVDPTGCCYSVLLSNAELTEAMIAYGRPDEAPPEEAMSSKRS